MPCNLFSVTVDREQVGLGYLVSVPEKIYWTKVVTIDTPRPNSMSDNNDYWTMMMMAALSCVSQYIFLKKQKQHQEKAITQGKARQTAGESAVV